MSEQRPQSAEELFQSNHELLQMNLITSMRIYDCLLTIVRQNDKVDAETLLTRHEQWEYIGPLPFKFTEE